MAKKKERGISQMQFEALEKALVDFPGTPKELWDIYKSTQYDAFSTIKEACKISGENLFEKVELFKRELNETRNKTRNSDSNAEKNDDDNNNHDIKRPIMRTSEEVYNRIKWDPYYNEEHFIIGYLDRFSGIQEIPMNQFESEITNENFIPWHRVQYFRRLGNNELGEIVWDRRNRSDLIFTRCQEE